MEKLLNELLEKIIDKQFLIKQILDSTLQQSKSLKEGNVEKFEQYMSVRQNLMDKIDTLDENMVLIMKKLSLNYGVEKLENIKSNDIVYDILLARENIIDWVEEIISIDNLNQAKGQVLLEELRKSMKTAKIMRKINTAYSQNNTSLGIIDRKS